MSARMRDLVARELIANLGIWINGADLVVIGGGHEGLRRFREIARDPEYRVDGYVFEVRPSERGRWWYRAVVDTSQLRLWGDNLDAVQLELFP